VPTMTELTAQPRTTISKKENERLRTSGMVPAVMYGKKQDATAIAIDAKAFLKAWKEAGESTILTIKGLGADKDVLIHEVTVDTVKEVPLHVDLYVVDSATEVEVEVPLVFEGIAPAEKELGGTLMKVLHGLSVSALPKHLPHEIVIDISGLVDFDSQIHASDVTLPPHVTLVTEPEEVIALVAAAREEEEELSEAPDMSAIEVEQKGKKPEEEE
jgi:large subunit ribosomal protein L25